MIQVPGPLVKSHLGATTLSITTLSITTFSITTLSIIGLVCSLSKNDTQHIVMLNVAFTYCYTECLKLRVVTPSVVMLSVVAPCFILPP
jgi:hypothetical protein